MQRGTRIIKETKLTSLSPEAFASLGNGKIAYVKVTTLGRALELCPAIPVKGEPTDRLLLLFGAGGNVLAFAQSREWLDGHAWENNLRIAHLH